MTVKETLATACRILAMQGHNDMIYGHVSALTETPGQYWIKGSGIGLEEVTEDDLVLDRLRRQYARRQAQTPQRISDPQRSVSHQPRDPLRHSYASDLFDDHRLVGASPLADHQSQLRLLSARR